MLVSLAFQPLLSLSSNAPPQIIGGVVAGLFIIAALMWLIFGRGPGRSRAYRRAQHILHQGNCQEALNIIHGLQGTGRLSAAWQGRLRNVEGECHHAAGDAALRDHRFEECLQHYQTAAGLLNLDEAELRARVIETMLAEVRRLFAAGPKERDAAQNLIARTAKLQSPCPEASFWQGLCQARGGKLEEAVTALTASHEEGGKRFIDPPLYLGALLVRAGRMQDGLRFLAEANRLDPNCPLVTLQLGTGIVAAGGDSSLAARAIQRALGPRGLGLWVKSPQRVWIEAFPEARSYVRRLASKHAYVCPVFGGDVAGMIRHGQFALAQAYYRQGHFQEAADLFGKLLQDSPPSASLLRGFGLSLARLERYDQAYKHLRGALELEEPKDPITAGYLALCGAMGKPIRPEDRVRNIEWAISLLSRFDCPGSTEWAKLYSAVFTEARQLAMPVPVEDQVRLCDVLAKVHASDPEAAAAYSQLAATSVDAVRPIHAWHYCRAAQEHGFSSDQDLALFSRTFRGEEAARGYYAQRAWDLDEVAYTYLERCAVQRPGHFPEELGPDYPARGEEMLLVRSVKQEAAGQKDAALTAADVLLKLAPQSVRAHDRLAQLYFQRGELDRAAALLGDWQSLAPTDHWPSVRKAVVEQRRANPAGRSEAIHRALGLTCGPTRAAVAYLGARLALSAIGDRPSPPEQQTQQPTADCRLPTADWQQVTNCLKGCLNDQPDHVEALWCLAAVRTALGDQPRLAEQAASMDRPDVKDARFHYLAAICHLAAQNYLQVLQAGQRAAALADGGLAVESEYLMGWAYLHLRDMPAATAAFQKVAGTPSSPSADHARAVLGQLSFARGDYDDAIKWWNALDARKRADWKLDEPLRNTVFLTGLMSHEAGQFEQAADKFREAGRLGLRDRRLGSLMVVSLVKAGQHLLYGDNAQGNSQGLTTH
jgi:tetratricopeptide (TPR) repeat protein